MTSPRAPSTGSQAYTFPGWLPDARRHINHTVVSVLDRTGAAAAEHWLLLVNAGLASILLGAFAVAWLRSTGATWLSELIATAYLLLCPQRPGHSYFLFGQQMALEQREVAMIGAQILAGVVYARLRHRLRALGLPFALALALPLAWDVGTQMRGWRESDWLTRTWTGAFFSLALVFWTYPTLERSYRRARGAAWRLTPDGDTTRTAPADADARGPGRRHGRVRGPGPRAIDRDGPAAFPG